MAAMAGRQVLLTRGGVAIAGVREKGITFAGEPIDITDGNSDGWQELLEIPSVNSVEISISGVVKDNVLKSVVFTSDRIEETVITYADGGEISGDFYLGNYSETGPHDDALTFEATLMSTGVVTYTPPA